VPDLNDPMALESAPALVMRKSLPASDRCRLIIDEEFERLIPPLVEQERDQLEANLLAEGCLHPLTVWAETQVLLDGHNRYRFCRARDIAYTVVEVSLDSRDDARRWIIDHQLGRRNVSPVVASYLRGKRYNLIKGRRGGRRHADGPTSATPSAARSLAAEHQVDEKTIKRDGKFADALDQLVELGGHRIKEALLSGKVKFTRAAVSRVVSLPADVQRTAAEQISQGEIRSLAEVLVKFRLPTTCSSERSISEGVTRFDRAMHAASDFRAVERNFDQTARLVLELATSPAGVYLATRTNNLIDGMEHLKQAILRHLPGKACSHCDGQGCSECHRSGFVPMGRTNRPAVQ
jgi:hypothetical protein